MRNLHEWLIGPPLPTMRLKGERLDNIRALAALSPDALSSIAYANQEIYLGLIMAGSVSLSYSIPIALAITFLLVVLTVSYSQTIIAYPTGGGSYTVAKENLGKLPGLVAAASLLIDYVLTAAVSLTAGVAAIASAFPFLFPYRVELALILLVVITLANMRGLKEAGTLIAVPVYLFLAAYFIMIAYGLFRAVTEGAGAIATHPPVTGIEPLTLVVILKTFSSGCTALTGVEAISNGVPIFRPPESRNARNTLLMMSAFMGILLLGSIGLTQHFNIMAAQNETILSALARHIFGTNILYYFVQFTVLFMLVVAANTSFIDFPRVGSLLANDRYLPRQLTQLGDRLVFSNGIILLAVLVGLLIILFGGDSHALIPLFAVGVFLAFTLSQSGMVVHWIRLRNTGERSAGWRTKAFLNGIGAVTTGITFLVVAASKFADGAWIIAVLIPLLVLAFRTIEMHYIAIAPQLSLQGMTPPALTAVPPVPSDRPRIILPVAGVHRGTLKALDVALSLTDQVTAAYVEIDPARTEKIRKEWELWGKGVPLVVLSSPFRSVIEPLIDYLEQVDQEIEGQVMLVLPEFIPARWWQNLLHNQTAWAIKLTLTYQRWQMGSGRIIIDVPFQLH